MLYNNSSKSVNYVRKPTDKLNYLRDIYTDTSEWQPSVKILNNEDIRKYEKKEERKIRYVQRKK